MNRNESGGELPIEPANRVLQIFRQEREKRKPRHPVVHIVIQAPEREPEPIIPQVVLHRVKYDAQNVHDPIVVQGFRNTIHKLADKYSSAGDTREEVRKNIMEDSEIE